MKGSSPYSRSTTPPPSYDEVVGSAPPLPTPPLWEQNFDASKYANGLWQTFNSWHLLTPFSRPTSALKRMSSAWRLQQECNKQIERFNNMLKMVQSTQFTDMIQNVLGQAWNREKECVSPLAALGIFDAFIQKRIAEYQEAVRQSKLNLAELRKILAKAKEDLQKELKTATDDIETLKQKAKNARKDAKNKKKQTDIIAEQDACKQKRDLLKKLLSDLAKAEQNVKKAEATLKSNKDARTRAKRTAAAHGVTTVKSLLNAINNTLVNPEKGGKGMFPALSAARGLLQMVTQKPNFLTWEILRAIRMLMDDFDTQYKKFQDYKNRLAKSAKPSDYDTGDLKQYADKMCKTTIPDAIAACIDKVSLKDKPNSKDISRYLRELLKHARNTRESLVSKFAAELKSHYSTLSADKQTDLAASVGSLFDVEFLVKCSDYWREKIFTKDFVSPQMDGVFPAYFAGGGLLISSTLPIYMAMFPMIISLGAVPLILIPIGAILTGALASALIAYPVTRHVTKLRTPKTGLGK